MALGTSRVFGVFYIILVAFNFTLVGTELSFLGPVMSSLYFGIQD